MTKAPKTRKELLSWFWSVKADAALDVTRFSGQYCLLLWNKAGKPFICATGIRCIDSLSFDGWADLVATKRWEIL